MVRRLRSGSEPPITTRIRLNPEWPFLETWKSSTARQSRCEARLTRLDTRKLGDPAVEGCAVKANKCPQPVKELVRLPSLVLRGSLSPRCDGTKGTASIKYANQHLRSGRVQCGAIIKAGYETKANQLEDNQKS